MDNYTDNIALLYGAAAIALTVFYIAFRAGWSGTAKAARRGGFLAVFGLFVGLLGFAAAQGTVSASGSASGAAAGLLFVMLIGAALAIAGLGLSLGGVVAHRGRLAKLSASSVPLLVVCAGVAAVHTALAQERAAFRTAQAVFHTDIVHGTIAGHPVSLPVAPHYAITHACASRPQSTCHSMFWTATELNDAAPDDLEIFTLEARPGSDDVLREVGDWCADRPDVQDTIWCAEPSDYRLTLRPAEDVDAVLDANGWRAVTGASEDARLACRQHEGGPTCRLQFDVADGVIAEAAFFGVPGETVLRAEEMVRARTQRLWQALSEM